MIQTFAIAGRTDLWNRMPSAHEMRDWTTEIVQARSNKLAGLGWYCYRRAAGNHTHWLQKDRYDEQGEHRWLAVSDAGTLLFSGE